MVEKVVTSKGVKKAVDVNLDGKKYQKIDNYYYAEKGIYSLLKRNIKTNTNTLLLGPTSVGKTELVNAVANELDCNITIFDMGTMVDPIMGLVGTHIMSVKDGLTNSVFKTSRFVDAIQQPGIILLDELSRASAIANNLLFPCLDFRRELAMEYSFNDNDPIKIHPECCFIATANLGSQYTGTHKLDKALADRFMIIEVEELGREATTAALETYIETSLVKNQIDDLKLNKIIDTYLAINKDHKEFKISFNLSLRHAKNIVSLVNDGFTIYDSFYTICKGLGGKEALSTIDSILSSTKK